MMRWIFLIGFIVYFNEMQLAFNSDVAYLLHATKLFLAGGTYVKDFFETNPPMIFILYSPIVIIQNWTSWDLQSITNAYVIILSLFSLSLCNALLKKIVNKELRNLILIVLVFNFLIASIIDFGQREHLLAILSTPYLLSVVIRAEKKPLSVYVAIIVGFMAGLGFSLKPFFLAPLVMLEIYLIVKQKNFFSWIRLESLIIMGVMISYLSYIYAYHPLYLNTMLPLLSHWYFIGTEESWTAILSRIRVLYCLGIAAYYFVSHPKGTLAQVLIIALIGFILAFIIPRSAWGYHVLPAFSLAIMLNALYAYQKWPTDLKMIAIATFIIPLAIYTQTLYLLWHRYQIEAKINIFEPIKNMPHNTIYCFSAFTTGICFPLTNDHHMEFAGRFPMFWWFRGILFTEQSKNKKPDYLAREKKYFIDGVAYDLNYYKPQLIIISSFDEPYLLPRDQTFVSYFSENNNFRKAWSHYQWLTNKHGFVIYQRVTPMPAE